MSAMSARHANALWARGPDTGALRTQRPPIFATNSLIESGAGLFQCLRQ
jgi:hypothetical protein